MKQPASRDNNAQKMKFALSMEYINSRMGNVGDTCA